MFVGIYDPVNVFVSQNLDLEEYYIPPDIGQLVNVINDAMSKNRVPFVTIEWTCPDSTDPENVLEKMTKGEYDGQIAGLVGVMKMYSGTILLRMFHEMDITGLYCWSGSTVQFIAAFRHARDLFRAASNVVWVWSPAGNINAGEFYPGKSYVDLVGFTLLESPLWDKIYNAPPQSFDEVMKLRYGVLSKFGKPMVATEFGVDRATDIERHLWLDDALVVLKSGKYPLINGLVFFNAKNAENDHTGQVLPNWTLATDMIWSKDQMPAVKFPYLTPRKEVGFSRQQLLTRRRPTFFGVGGGVPKGALPPGSKMI